MPIAQRAMLNYSEFVIPGISLESLCIYRIFTKLQSDPTFLNVIP